MTVPAKPTILVVDDDVDELAQATQILNPRDYEVVSSTDFESAIAKAGAYEIDLLLCDRAMSRRQAGRDLVAEILLLPNCGDVPVIFSSSGQAAGVIRRQHVFGGAYHVKKPFDSMVLIALVERTLWMPRLVETHLNRPHFNIGPMFPVGATIPIPTVSSS